MINKLSYVLFLVSLSGFSQEVSVGRVYDGDTRLPLSGVEVKSDTIVTSSNALGYFQVKKLKDATLVARLNGFETQTIKLPNEPRFAFSMKRIESPLQTDLIRSFYMYLGEKINYPSEARKNYVQGLVTVYFEVDSLNRIIKTEVIKSLEKGCDKEVLRVLQNAPGVWYDVKRYTKFMLSVRFRLGNSKGSDQTVIPEPGIILLDEFVVTAR